MITRIVKLKFKEEHLDTFYNIFNESKDIIESFEGCHTVELRQDLHDPTTLFTLSTWTSEDHLNQYRNSPFFEKTWTSTKQLFDGKPLAWSLCHYNKENES